MTGVLQTIAAVAVYVCAPDGPSLDGERSATDFVGEALGAGAAVVAIPVGRLAPDFLVLSNRKAGEAIQKFVNYGLKVAFVGDVSGPVAASDALRDFVRESNRGRHVWFVEHMAALEAKIASQG
ncbi:DUF4180 domain-containing protein [Phenylobacterium sp.]|uniref:DUF4180 domain-containing protein n=1 Tax=Phenylobacterium sp. TaxID=1871053 RepID=UPI00301E5C6E